MAWSGTGPVATVEISVGGGPWQPARMIGASPRHGWQWWDLVVRLDDAGPTDVRARATDVTGRTQPEHAEWNRLGYGNNAIQAVPIVAG